MRKIAGQRSTRVQADTLGPNLESLSGQWFYSEENGEPLEGSEQRETMIYHTSLKVCSGCWTAV